MHPVVLTRPEGRNEALAQRLRSRGCETLVLPALTISPLPAQAATLPLPNDYDLVIFVSGTAARAYAAQLRALAAITQWPVQVPTACVGPATAAALRGDFWPDTLRVLCPMADAASHDSEALWQVLAQSDLGLRRVLLVRGTTGREWLAQRLAQKGVRVDRYAVYARAPAAWPIQAQQVLAQWRAAAITPVWLLTSTEGADAVHRQIIQTAMQPWWRGHRFVLTHPRLAVHLLTLLGVADKAAYPMVKISLPGEAQIEQALLALCRESS